MKQGFDLVNMNIISKLIEHDTIPPFFFKKKNAKLFSDVFRKKILGEFSLNILEIL